MTDTTNNLSDLIEISEDGTAFYEEAAQKVKDKKLSTLFTRLAKAKSELAQELSGEIKAPAKATKRQPADRTTSRNSRWSAPLSTWLAPVRTYSLNTAAELGNRVFLLLSVVNLNHCFSD